MVAVTVFNSTRMAAIEAAAIVNGTVNGSGHLILTKHDGSTVDAGYVLGTGLPATGGTMTGDLVMLGAGNSADDMIQMRQKGDPRGWGEIRNRGLNNAGGVMLLAFPPGGDPDTDGYLGIVVQISDTDAPNHGTTQIWGDLWALGDFTIQDEFAGPIKFRIYRDTGNTVIYGTLRANSPYVDGISVLNAAASDARYDALGAATAAVSGHASAGDPHPVYTTSTEASALDTAAIAAHAALADPHPTYLTATEGNAAYDASGAATTAVSNHAAAADPHPTYLTATEGNAAYVAKGNPSGHTKYTAASATSSGTTPLVIGDVAITCDGVHNAKVTYSWYALTKTASADAFLIQLKDPSGTVVASQVLPTGTTTVPGGTITGVTDSVPASGARHFTCELVRTSGSGTIVTVASATAPGRIMVEQWGQ